MEAVLGELTRVSVPEVVEHAVLAGAAVEVVESDEPMLPLVVGMTCDDKVNEAQAD